jgi:O-antigen/teichoic acid export membrane protein
MPIADSPQTLCRPAGLKGRLTSYVTILAIGSAARVFGLASQFVVLIMLGRILSKEGFGDLMTAFGFYRLASSALGIGGSLVLLYHVSRAPSDRATEIKLHRYSALLGTAFSALAALAGYSLAGTIGAMLGKPGLVLWFRELAPFAIFSTLLTTSTGALEGRSRISESIAVAEVIPNALRIVLLPAIACLDLPQEYVAHALTISVLLPWLWAGRRLWDRSVAGLRQWTAWDFNYCWKFAVASLFAYQLGAVDVIIAGVLFPSSVVADYALAARIAALYSFLQIVLLKRFTPRAAISIEIGDLRALRQEAELCRQLMICCGALTMLGILSLAPFILPLFGNYSGAGTFLVWLAIPTFLQSFYETADRLLIIAGQANIPLMLTAASFLVLAVVPFLAAPLIGVAAIPAAMIVSALALYPIPAARVQKLFSVTTIGWRDTFLIAGGAGGLYLYATAGTAASGLAAYIVLAGIACHSGIAAMKVGGLSLAGNTLGPAGSAISRAGD